MTNMLKSGKALEIFSVKDIDLRKFAEGAKQYGIVYCVLRNKKNTPDGLCDILVKADDAPKISRVIERFKFATVDKAKIESEIVQSKSARMRDAEPAVSNKANKEKLLDDLLGTNGDKSMSESQPEIPKRDGVRTFTRREPEVNPHTATTEISRPSEPISNIKRKSAEGITENKPSVKDNLRKIKAARQSQKKADSPKRDDKQSTRKPQTNSSTIHNQSPTRGNPKTKKQKAR